MCAICQFLQRAAHEIHTYQSCFKICDVEFGTTVLSYGRSKHVPSACSLTVWNLTCCYRPFHSFLHCCHVRNVRKFWPQFTRPFLSLLSSVICQTTGPKPLPKRFLHIVRSRASSFNWQYPLLSVRSSSSFLRLLPRLLLTSLWTHHDGKCRSRGKTSCVSKRENLRGKFGVVAEKRVDITQPDEARVSDRYLRVCNNG